ncbi:AAA-ATPase At5g40000 [Selaginella moellendorffii]|uniref:AAA-ATPase At5g40000 n=1 Tax=Selaginella moellendorffii TaxID=88036 RepID=UPI000D1CCE13|nr:AAA-ATPase At5g40000 [Selaginella moellendorffii]|eukprot:XP_024534157.1 AAA-ATPase At5g40000 [Selaginella moellendorffii]
MASSRSVVVYENDGGALYNYVNSYLSSLTVNPEQPALFRASLIDDKTPLILGLQPGFPVRDKFQGLDFEWSTGVATDESRYVMAAFPPHCSNDVIQAYFSHLTTASKRRRLFTVRPPGMHEMSWASCEFDHPASLETLDCSMDAELKQELVKDLEAFAGARDYYRSIGKAWKRSYLVYGRQATGKDQLVAAIANKLGYDVYDLDTGLVGNRRNSRRSL